MAALEERIARAAWADLAKLVLGVAAIGAVAALAGVYRLGFLVTVLPLAVMAARNTRAACVIVALLSPLVSIGAVDVGFHLLPGYVVIAAGLAGALVRREWRGVRPHWLDAVLIGFGGLATLISVATLGTNPDTTVLAATGANSSELRSPAQLGALLLMAGLYALFRIGIRSREALHAAVRALLATFALVALYGLYQALARVTGLPFAFVNDRRTLADLPISGHRYVRINSTLPEASPLAAFSFIPFTVGAAMLLSGERRLAPTRGVVAITLLALSILIASLSKAAVIAALIALPLLIPLRRASVSRRRAAIVVTALMATVVVAVAGGIAVRAPTVLSNPSQIERSESYVRVGYWRASVGIAKAHPLGVGVGNYTFYYPRYAPISYKYEYYQGVADGHSWYFEALAETGFLGAALLILFAFGLPIAAFRHRDRDGPDGYLVRALAVAWLAGAIMHMSYSYFYYPFEWVLAGLLAAALGMRERRGCPRPAPEETGDAMTAIDGLSPSASKSPTTGSVP